MEVFFYDHKNEEWFQEKYSPLFKSNLAKHFTSQTQNSFKAFSLQLEKGNFDQLDLTISADLIKSFAHQNGTHLNFHGNVDLPEDLVITSGPYHGFDPNSLTLFIKAVPKNISREGLLRIFSKLEGFASLSLSDPLRSHDFVRYGWAAFINESLCAQGFLLAQPVLQSDLDLSLMRSKTAKRFFRVMPEFSIVHLVENLILSAELIRVLDFTHGIFTNPLIPSSCVLDNWQSLNDVPDMLRCVDIAKLLRLSKRSPTQQFDLQISYLRKVHYFCYFTVTQFNDERKLSAKSGCAFLRAPLQLSKTQQGNIKVGPETEAFIEESAFDKVMIKKQLINLTHQGIKKQTILTDWNFKTKVLLAKHILKTAQSIK